MHRGAVPPRGMTSVGTYWHTLRYLKPSQIAARLLFTVHIPRVDARPPPARRIVPGKFAAPMAAAASMHGPGTFRFLGIERELPVSGGWDDPADTKLWRYNLHYFNDLNASGCELRSAWHRALLERWVAENPPGRGTAWEPYPTSLRIVNWIKWSLAGNRWPAAVEHSLAVQARWLSRRIEHHLLGNHLFANAKALLFAGLFFEGPEADGWFAAGRTLVERELSEQVLTDGGHFERSPMYHALFMEDVLDICNVLRAFERDLPADWLRLLPRMQCWLDAMTHPDGEVSFFNDSAFDIAPTCEALAAYARRMDLGPPTSQPGDLTVLADSGYARLHAGRALLLCDCAPVGPDYLPAHAHADTLAFELSLGSQRVFVNSGTSEYGTGAERQRQRGTAAHNTVVIDGEDSSEVWAGFRVGRRARAQMHVVSATPAVAVRGTHDGYRRLSGRNVHTRTWTLDTQCMTIEDEVSGAARSKIAFFHLHPQVSAQLLSEHEVRLHLPDGTTVLFSCDERAQVRIGSGTWHPRFGAAIANSRLIVRLDDRSAITRVSWSNS
jgi:uncharacterized heparinase superfamily protein